MASVPSSSPFHEARLGRLYGVPVENVRLKYRQRDLGLLHKPSKPFRRVQLSHRKGPRGAGRWRPELRPL